MNILWINIATEVKINVTFSPEDLEMQCLQQDTQNYWQWITIIHRVSPQNKNDMQRLVITLGNANLFSKSFTGRFTRNCVRFPPHHLTSTPWVATVPCKIQKFKLRNSTKTIKVNLLMQNFNKTEHLDDTCHKNHGNYLPYFCTSKNLPNVPLFMCHPIEINKTSTEIT